MNVVLFEPTEIDTILSSDDRRVRHVRGVLRIRAGEPFDAGLIDGPLGKARFLVSGPHEYRVRFDPTGHPPPACPIRLLVGATRPVAAQRILLEAASLGVCDILVTGTDKGEASYLASRLWRQGHYRSYLVAGAEQGFTTRLPRLELFQGLDSALRSQAVDTGEAARIALDNYEMQGSLSAWRPARGAGGGCVLAVGPERGWSGRERDLLRGAGFFLAGLGPRVLKTETAVVAGVSLLGSALGCLE